MHRFFSSVFAVIGIICLCVAVGAVIHTRQFLASARSVRGAVVELVQSDSDGGSSSAPKVHYSVSDRTYEFTGSISANPPAYHLGQDVMVVYDQSAPEKGRLDVWWEHYFLALISGVIGLVFSVIGVGGMLIRRRPTVAPFVKMPKRAEIS